MDLNIEISGGAYRVASTYRIINSAGAVSTSSIDIEVVSPQTVPRTQSLCVIYDGTTPIFRGLISSIVSPEFSSGYEVKRYRVELQSMECIFNNRLVSEAFTGKFTHEIIQSLYDNYLAIEGIELGEISTTEQQYDNYNCQYTRLGDVLQELAEDINATYYISPDNKFYFLTRDAFIQIDAPEHITQLQLNEETGDLRTVQIVSGATEKTTQQTENKYWETGLSTMPLGYQVSSVVGMTINGASAGVGKRGVDEDNAAKTFLYEVGSNSITVNPNATVKPSAGQNVVIVYYGYFEIVVSDSNDALIGELSGLNGTSGRIENVLTDETIDTFSDADTKALALLDQFNTREQTVTCVCHDLDSTELFLMWFIDRPDLNIQGQYVIIEREISSFTADTVLIRITLKNKGFFARYGTVLNKGTKNKGSDTKIYKSTLITDTIYYDEEITVDTLDLLYYPTNGEYADPMLDNFYPGV